MGGSSGVLLSIMFMGMSSHWESGSNWSSLPEAFKAGLQAMMDAGGASPGSRTMLDALVPAADALIEEKGLTGAAAAAKEGCEATKSMKPKAGRSENVPESVLKGVPDPGAKAAARVERFEGLKRMGYLVEVAGGALPWPDLQERLLKRMAKLGTQAEHLALQVLANIPESYLSSEDCLVRLPRQDRACVRCEDLAALKHELRDARPGSLAESRAALTQRIKPTWRHTIGPREMSLSALGCFARGRRPVLAQLGMFW
eukprot:g13859.t1